MASVFEGIFREYTLGYVVRTPTVVGGERQRDLATGNYAFTDVPQTLKVFLKNASTSRKTEITDRYGVDDKAIIVTGRCIDPVALPAALTSGEPVSVTLNGQAGTFRIVLAVPSTLEILDELLGQRFDGLWRPQSS